MKAVVTDARLRAAVNIIRALGGAGISVVAAEAEGTANVLGFRSKCTSSRLRLGRQAKTAPSIADLKALLSAAGPDGVIVPGSTPMVTLLAEHREAFGEHSPKALVPAVSSLRLAHDKSECFKLATTLGVPVPVTSLPWEEGADATDPVSLEKWAENLHYPAILKYRLGEDLGLPAAQRYRVAKSPREAVQAYLEMNARQKKPFAQEYVEGQDYGAAFLYDSKSHLVASFTYRSIRERPKGAGPTVFAVSQYEPRLVEYGHKILSALKWQGVAMLDFRKGPDGRFLLLEINPRFWGSLALAILSGIDFPLLYFRCCTGEPVQPVVQKDGVRIRFFPQDLLSIRQYLGGPGNGFGYLVMEALTLLNPGLKDGLFTFSDPVPGLMYLAGGVFGRNDRA